VFVNRPLFDLPPRPRLLGRRNELATLQAALANTSVTRLALVGGGGSGKSVLAAALAHRLRRSYAGGAAWFRIGDWDHRTLLQLLALKLRVPPEPLVDNVRNALFERGPLLLVLDNHENDRALARFFDLLAGTPVTWLVTARRCLLSGMAVFPVVAPLVNARGSAFPAVKELTSLLRWNPLALDIADAFVATRDASVDGLRDSLLKDGVERVRVMAHEDDVPEVALLVEWAWARLPGTARRLWTVLAHCPGDHMDAASLTTIARLGKGGDAALALLRRWRLVQEPAPGRFALHAVVKYAVSKKGAVAPERYFDHYMRLLERNPSRFVEEQSHLFAAMDHAQAVSSLEKLLRINALLFETPSAS